MNDKPSLLVVDQFEETREVLRTVFQRRGVEILEARRADRGLQLARKHQPDVIVLDLETESANADSSGVSSQFEEQARLCDTPMVLLGSISVSRSDRAVGDDFVASGSEPESHFGEYVAKPYQYGPLVRRIEALLQRHKTAR